MHQHSRHSGHQDSVAPTSRTTSRAGKTKSKAAMATPFERYMKKYYGEHFRRVVAWRRAARWVLVVYPMVSAGAVAAPFVALQFALKQLFEMKPDWFTNVVPLESEPTVMTAVTFFIGFAALLGLFLGIGLGVSRSRLLNFEAEKTELNVRQSYFLRRIFRNQRHSGGSYLS